MAKEKIRPSSLMMVDVDDLRELVQSEIEGVLAMEKDVNASEVYLTHKPKSVIRKFCCQNAR